MRYGKAILYAGFSLALTACCSGHVVEKEESRSCLEQAESFSADLLSGLEAIREENLYRAFKLIQDGTDNEQEVNDLEELAEPLFVPPNAWYASVESSLAIIVEGYSVTEDDVSCKGEFDPNERDEILGKYSELWDQALAALAERAGG